MNAMEPFVELQWDGAQSAVPRTWGGEDRYTAKSFSGSCEEKSMGRPTCIS